MTFTEIVDMVALDLNIATTKTESITRIGTHVNRRYRVIMRRLGLNVFSRAEFDFDCTPATNIQTVLANNDPVITRIVSIWYQAPTTPPEPEARAVPLEQLSADEMRSTLVGDGIPTKWCRFKEGSETVTFKINSTIPDGLTLILEAELTKSTLAGTDVPDFSEEFHELLVIGAKADELRKMEKPSLAREFLKDFEDGVNELSLKAVIGAHQDIVQNKYGVNRRRLRGTRVG
jgi:hypothetical protein